MKMLDEKNVKGSRWARGDRIEVKTQRRREWKPPCSCRPRGIFWFNNCHFSLLKLLGIGQFYYIS